MDVNCTELPMTHYLNICMEIQIYWEFVQDKSKRMGDSGGDGLV